MEIVVYEKILRDVEDCFGLDVIFYISGRLFGVYCVLLVVWSLFFKE